ncbi:hypothetical protein MA16_Dca023243 [Dendrobium catenatum]|uniref:Uncharacterized protein n=1 Tax=Dendrobium catenatum TaxID=906689 RepID=A0A2I0W1Y5_9ASPA|nr:hypothetical protein MA16_Dca023243 [Dendrobium catenatum]
MSSSSKRSRLAAGSSSSSCHHSARFLSAENEDAYHKYKACKITPSKMLNQAALNFEMPLSIFFSIGDKSLKNPSLMKKMENMPPQQLQLIHDDMQHPELAFYSNNSFNVLHSTRLHSGDEEPQRDEEEEAPAPIPTPILLRQHSQLDQLVERYDQLLLLFTELVPGRLMDGRRPASAGEFAGIVKGRGTALAKEIDSFRSFAVLNRGKDDVGVSGDQDLGGILRKKPVGGDCGRTSGPFVIKENGMESIKKVSFVDGKGKEIVVDDGGDSIDLGKKVVDQFTNVHVASSIGRNCFNDRNGDVYNCDHGNFDVTICPSSALESNRDTDKMADESR